MEENKYNGDNNEVETSNDAPEKTSSKTKMKKTMWARFAPILGAGAIGVCPLCWVGSASLLTYIGLGALIPVWQWIVFALLGMGLVGFAFDYKSHKNPYPIVALVVGGAMLYVGRYIVAFWPVWVSGAFVIIGAVWYNKKLFSNKK